MTNIPEKLSGKVALTGGRRGAVGWKVKRERPIYADEFAAPSLLCLCALLFNYAFPDSF